MKKFLINLSSSAIAGWGLFGRKIMESLNQFFTHVAPFLLIVSILVLGTMFLFEQKKSKQLEQENSMLFFLINQLSDEMEREHKQTIHVEIELKGLSTICLADNNGKEAPGKDLIRIRAVFTSHLGIKITP